MKLCIYSPKCQNQTSDDKLACEACCREYYGDEYEKRKMSRKLTVEEMQARILSFRTT